MRKRGRTGRGRPSTARMWVQTYGVALFQNVLCCLTQVNAIEAADWPPVITGQRQSCLRESYMRVATVSSTCVTAVPPVYLAVGQGMSFTCPIPDHRPDALTERVEAPRLGIAVAVTVYPFLGLTVRDAQGGQRPPLGLRNVPDCCGAETD